MSGFSNKPAMDSFTRAHIYIYIYAGAKYIEMVFNSSKLYRLWQVVLHVAKMPPLSVLFAQDCGKYA